MGADHSSVPRSTTRADRRAQQHRARATRVVALIAAFLVATGAVLAGILVFDGPEHRTPTARAENPVVPVTKPPAPPLVVPTPPVTEAPALPQPEAAPADPYENVPIVAIGEMEIPKIGLVHTIYEGVSLTVVNHGPGHWPGTPMPGGYGNMVFAGHRTTYDHPFRNLDQLVEGDAIIFRTDQGTFTYRVTRAQVVHWDDVWIVDQHPGRTVTLFACHPPGSAEYRYVVFGELVTP